MPKKTKVAIVRGKYLSLYEMQNYAPLAKEFELVGFGSLKPTHEKVGFPVKKLFSPMDLPNFPYKLPILNRLCLGDAMYLFGLEKALKGFDIAHVRETYFHFTQQALNAKKKGLVKKVICTCSETIPFNHEGIWHRKKFKTRAIREVDHFHCLTNKARECLVKEGCDPKKITVIPYGVNLGRFMTYDLRFKNKNKLNILFVGRLVKEKGIYDLLKAFVQLIKGNKNLKLTLIGKGEEEDNIRTIIDASPILLNSVKVKSVSYTKIPKEYQKADILVLLSKPTRHWEEYFGMAIVEAMASGLPIVSTKSGVIPKVIANTGILVQPGDVKEVVEALKKLIEDDNLRRNLGSKARKRVEKFFDAQKQAKKIGRLYQ